MDGLLPRDEYDRRRLSAALMAHIRAVEVRMPQLTSCTDWPETQHLLQIAQELGILNFGHSEN